MRVSIVGGSGFLGGHLVRALVRDSASTKITVMDRRAYAGAHADRVTSVPIDVTRLHDCVRALGEESFDAVVSMVTPDLLAGTTNAFERVNVGGIRALVTACEAQGVRALVYVSSIAVMDHFRDHVDCDEDTPLPPLHEYRSPYDRTKRIGEDTALAADSPGGLRTCSLRMGGILSDMGDICLRYLQRRPIVVLGHGKPIDMIYGGNAAHAITLAIRGLLDRPDEVGGQALFVTKGRPTTNVEYTEWVAGHLGEPVRYMPASVRKMLHGGLWARHRARTTLGLSVPGIPLHDFLRIQYFTQTFDNSRVKRVLGFEPLCSLEDGVASIVDEYRHRTARR